MISSEVKIIAGVYIVSHVLGEGYSVRACLAGAHILAKSFSQEPRRCLMVSSSLQWHMGSRDLPDLLALLAVQIILLSIWKVVSFVLEGSRGSVRIL
jgi:hypothetical protein